MLFLTKYWIQIMIVSFAVATIFGFLWSYGSKKWKEGYEKCTFEYLEVINEYNKKVDTNLPKVEKKYEKKIKSVQGSQVPVGPATTSVLDSLRREYEADNR